MWYPFKQQDTSYLKLAGQKEFHEDDSDNGHGVDTAATLVHKDEHEYFSTHGLVRPRKSCCTSPWCSLLTAFIGLFVSLVLGQFMRLEHNIDEYLPPYSSPQPIHQVFTLKTTFATPPSVVNSLLWTSLMPSGRGFVSHPSLTHGSIKSIIAFHQLHCLHGLRTAYFAQTNFLDKLRHEMNASYVYTENGYLNGMTEHELGLHHVKHCFEYLRQGVMCAADTNLEDTRVLEGGMVEAVAFGGYARVCRDWEGVRRWAEKWSAGGGEGIV